MKVTALSDRDGDWIVKTPSTAEEVTRLTHEAAQLRRAAHPAVVELRAFRQDDPVELRTRHAGRSLSECDPLTDSEVCGLGAAVATVLADLHDLGVVHGAIGPDHILIGADGRPVLCGFGDSGRTDERDGAVDVVGLATTLSGRLAPDASGRLVRVLRLTSRGNRRPPPARAFAAALSAATAQPRLPVPRVGPEVRAESPAADDRGLAAATTSTAPGRTTPSPVPLPPAPAPPLAPRARRSRRYLMGALVSVALLGAATLLAVTGVVALHRPTTTPSPCPPTDRGCVPIIVRHGVFVTASGTFAIAIPDPVVVVGRWSCRQKALPAALNPRTGQVWAWRSWADPSTVVTATAVATSPGARSLRVLTEASGCDLLQVIGADGRTTVMRPGGQNG